MAAVDGRIITVAEVSQELSQAVVDRIYDDDNDGNADDDPLSRLIKKAESKVLASLATRHLLSALPATAATAPELLKTICLDFARGYAYVRHPEVAREDGAETLTRARADAKMVANGQYAIPELIPATPVIGPEVSSDDLRGW